MADYTRLQNSFAAGYVDPTLHGLTNTEMYSQGLQECTNFIPSSLGYLYRRPGTSSTGWSWASDKREPFRLCVIKTSEGAMLVMFMDRRIVFGLEKGSRYEIADGEEISPGLNVSVPWEGDDLSGLDVFELQGSLYILHPDYPPHVIEHLDFLRWDLGFSDIQDATYDAPVEAEASDVGDIKAAGGFSCLQIQTEGGRMGAKGKYPTCQTFKGGRWYLSGQEGSPATIYVSKAPDARGSYRFNDFRLGEYYLLAVTESYIKKTIFSTTEADGDIESVEYKTVSDEEVRDRNALEDVTDILDYNTPEDTSTTVEKRYYTVRDEYGEPDVTDPTETKVLIVETTSTTYSLKCDIEPDDGIELTESDMYGSSVLWLLTQQRVIAGTNRSIWMDNGSAATPADFDMVQTLASTVSRVHPVMAGSMVIYVPGDMRSVRGFIYDDNAGGYRVLDISMGARTLFTSNVAQLALCEGIETILWVLLEDGTLLSCTIGATYGWARHRIGGNGFVTSIVAYHSDEGDSRLYMTVDRENGQAHRTTVERLDLQDLVRTEVFRLLDCAQDISDISNDGTVAMDALSTRYDGFTDGIGWAVHDGWPYMMDADGAYAPGIVSSGDSPTNPKVSTGYGYESRAVMLWQELPSNSQTSLGMKRRASSILMQLYRSGSPFGGYISQGTEVIEDLPRLAKAGAVQERTPELFSGLVRIPVPSYTDEMVNAVMVAREPLPMTILAVESKYKIMEA